MSERHRTDGLWGRQIRAAESANNRSKYKSHGSWGNWVRVRKRREEIEGDAICFIGMEHDYIVVLWDDTETPEMLQSSELLHYACHHKRKGWYPFENGNRKAGK